VVARFPDTEEVTGSNPVSPTIDIRRTTPELNSSPATRPIPGRKTLSRTKGKSWAGTTAEKLQHEDLAEKARVTADKVAREKLEEANREDKMNIHESRNSDPIQEQE
jgi:hypothetical protein